MSRGEYKDKTKAEYGAWYRATHREEAKVKRHKVYSLNSERDQERRAVAREFVLQQKAGKVCAVCGADDVTKLVFHHRDPATKLFEIGTGRMNLPQRVLDEIAKCDLLCKACHCKHHKPTRK